jgi:hypothetical protein
MQTLDHARRTIAAIVLVVYVPACYHYVTPKGITPEAYVAGEQPSQVRVTLTDGTVQTLLRPACSQDSVRGYIPVRQGNSLVRSGRPWAAPLTSVQRLEVQDFNTWGTVGLVFGGLVVVGGLVGLKLWADQMSSCCF